ncbi:MAG: redoxin domain-containing protein [Candidatus Promineifilaceae bacterium]|nr:redoxin domain-containing protein [Candidatus Promineifilaceae bacterium]
MSTQETELKQENSGRNWLVLIGGLALLVGIAFIIIYGLNPFASGETEERPSEVVSDAAPAVVDFPDSGPPLQVGDMPYNFELADLQGNRVSLQEFAGRPLIINYWATWCGPCRIEMPHLQNTFEAHQDKGLAVLALDQDETPQEVADFFTEFSLTFTPLMDEGKLSAENYGVGRTLPTSFFVNEAGEITAVHRGPMTQGQIDSYLAQTFSP